MDYSKLCAIVAFSAFIFASAGNAAPATLEIRVAAFEAGLRPAVRMVTAPEQRWPLAERMKHYKIPGISIAVIEGGKIIFAKGYGVKAAGGSDKVNTETVFSVGSLSKLGTATAVLKLASKDVVDIDAGANEYLKRWQVPSNKFTKAQAVTLRGLMSHSAGLSLGGFPDFKPGEKLPTVLDTLNGTGASQTVPVRAFYQPGTNWSYSGGGTTVTQLLLEDVTGNDFPALTRNQVFKPLGMNRSTYQNPLPLSHGNIAKAHDENGEVTALPRGWHAFPEMGASGLWTTPSDYARMMLAWMHSYHGDKDSYLPQTVAQDMMSEVGYSPFGLGPVLSGRGMSRRFRHSGSNESYRAYMEGHLEIGSGVVIFTNGTEGRGLYIEIRRAVADAFGWPFYQEIIVPDFEVDAGALTAFSGVYNVEHAGQTTLVKRYLGLKEDRQTFTVSVKDGGLLMSGHSVLALGPNQFVAEDGDTYFEFVRGLDGYVSGLVVRTANYAFALDRKAE